MLRPQIYARLDDLEGGVVIVSAPPGFGKSTLVVEWLTAQERRFSWYSLDRYDSDVGLFGEYLAAAVADLTGRESGLVPVPGETTPDTRTTIATLVDDLSHAPARSALVLDDYHQVEGTEVGEAVNYLADNLPEGLLLVVISRADPPLPLSRLRARGQLHEIRGEHLRFATGEVAEYFEVVSDMTLSAEQAEIVADRSDGWVAALQLVSLGIDEPDPATLTSSLSAQHPHIASYLVEEVFSRLDAELARFLLETCSFERFDAQLCREVAGISDADSLLADIARENAFLIPLGETGGWYRYHHLFAELLRMRLNRTDPHRQSTILNEAAVACERRGLTDDAVDYALRAENVQLAAEIVERNLGVALGAGEIPRLRSWLRLFPAQAGAATEVVQLGQAWCRVFEGDIEAATLLIDRIESDRESPATRDTKGQLQVMRAMVSFQAGDTVAAEAHARAALESLPPSSGYVESLAHLYVGRALFANAKRSEAHPHLEMAANLAERDNTLAAVSALFWLGVVDLDEGRIVDAERSMTRSREEGAVAYGPSGDPHPASGVGDIGLAYIRLNQLDYEEAIRHAERGSRLLKRSTFVEMVFRALFVWAEALSIAGRHADAGVVIDEGIEWLQGRRVGGVALETWLLMARARNSWRQGNLDEAQHNLDMVRQRGLGSPNQNEALGFYEAADAASLALRRGDVEQSRKMLAMLPIDPTHNVMFTIKRLVLTASLHELEGDPRSAVESLEEALALAHAGYRFQFTFGGPAIRPVLQRMVGRTRHDEFLRSIIDRLPSEEDARPKHPVEPLTEREIEVLEEIAAGYTNEEIADRLFISGGTVKRHTANIYMKLGAHHRAEAAAKGRDLGLIR